MKKHVFSCTNMTMFFHEKHVGLLSWPLLTEFSVAAFILSKSWTLGSGQRELGCAQGCTSLRRVFCH